jgi:heme A synthase
LFLWGAREANQIMTASPRFALHRMALVVLGATFLMIGLGAFVTSRDAGLSIPDPVTNHGEIVPSEQIRDGYVTPAGRAYSGGDVLSEFAHRGMGWLLGSLTITLAVVAWRTVPPGTVQPRTVAPRGVARLALAAVLLVILQGGVGALGVALRQPPWMVVPHAFLAQAFLAVIASIAALTAPSLAVPGLAAGTKRASVPGARIFQRGFLALAALTFCQLLLGASFRHANADAALYAHAGLALLLVSLTAWLATRALGLLQSEPGLARATALQGGLLMFQVFLGFLAWIFRRAKEAGGDRPIATLVFPTAHVVVGALLLVGFVVLAWRSRVLLAEGPAPARKTALQGPPPSPMVMP